MPIHPGIIAIAIFVLLSVLLRPWLRVRKEDGGIDKSRTNLRAIQVISWIIVISGVVLPLVARFEGKKPEHWPLLIMCAGIVGVFSHGVLKSMDKRITDIEKSKQGTGEQSTGSDS